MNAEFWLIVAVLLGGTVVVAWRTHVRRVRARARRAALAGVEQR